jgi:hypothetical protein
LLLRSLLITGGGTISLRDRAASLVTFRFAIKASSIGPWLQPADEPAIDSKSFIAFSLSVFSGVIAHNVAVASCIVRTRIKE